MEQQSKQVKLEKCPICESKRSATYLKTKDYFLTQEDFTIVQCGECGFVYTNPIPAISELSRYYDSPDYLSHTVKKRSITGFVYDSLRDLNIRNKYKLVSSLKTGNRILDIGQGTGELLAYFKHKGWEVIGIEPNESARKFAIDHFQVEVYNENKLDELSEGSFDIITLWHVLEHVPDLNTRMIQINRLLKEDGYIVIAVPNIESPDSVKYADLWAGLDVPRHLYHFSETSIRQLLEKHNLKLVSKHPMRFDAYYVSLLSEKYKGKSLPFIPAALSGFRSNRKARRTMNYSSMIFVAKQF